jgi:hypothetical protein
MGRIDYLFTIVDMNVSMKEKDGFLLGREPSAEQGTEADGNF